ncbi:hypothetical protein JOB18_048121 [Solea senegalensis]|uniref:Uncharacterized protein n=1 Tax=Solea senegalensis TaxID=28829 RepID=A0AAV6QIM7_SOLSE|nr:hypothetical protein JOB18_048121 [Solea senegalensis]
MLAWTLQKIPFINENMQYGWNLWTNSSQSARGITVRMEHANGKPHGHLVVDWWSRVRERRRTSNKRGYSVTEWHSLWDGPPVVMEMQSKWLSCGLEGETSTINNRRHVRNLPPCGQKRKQTKALHVCSTSAYVESESQRSSPN